MSVSEASDDVELHPDVYIVHDELKNGLTDADDILTEGAQFSAPVLKKACLETVAKAESNINVDDGKSDAVRNRKCSCDSNTTLEIVRKPGQTRAVPHQLRAMNLELKQNF